MVRDSSAELDRENAGAVSTLKIRNAS